MKKKISIIRVISLITVPFFNLIFFNLYEMSKCDHYRKREQYIREFAELSFDIFCGHSESLRPNSLKFLLIEEKNEKIVVAPLRPIIIILKQHENLV